MLHSTNNDSPLEPHRYATFFEKSAVGIVYGQIDGTVLETNPKFCELVGWRPEEIVGRSIFQFTHEDDKPETMKIRQELVSRQKEACVFEKRYMRKDGHIFWVQVSLTVLPDGNGVPTHFLATVQDIDERMKIQLSIKQSEAYFRHLAESIPQIVWIEDRTGHVEYLNRRWEDYTGLPIEESLGKVWLERMHPEDRDTIVATHPISLLNPHDSSDYIEMVQRLQVFDNSYRWFLSRAVAVRNEQGEFLRWLGTSTDIHDQKRIEQELIETQRLAIAASESKSAFLANMSHEIRTPLAIILGYCELLKKPGITPEMQNEFLNAMTKNGKELSVLIDNILDLSKIEAAKLKLEPRAFKMKALLDEVVESLRIKAEGKKLAIRVEWEGDALQDIVTDDVRLRQILINIIGNAIKFTDQGEIKVIARTNKISQHLEIDVVDTGCGLKSHETEILFKAFSQGDSSSTRRHGGTGLGLMLSRLLANALGGDIILLSTRYGAGSTFRITIDPRISEISHQVKREESPEPVSNGNLEGLKLLLVEDAPDNQFIVGTLLRNEGATVDVADNGRVALDMCGTQTYDVILMDIQMPVMDGYDATRELRNRGYRRPILALSAHALADDAKKSQLAGCNDHISKPIDFDRLIRAIRQHNEADRA